MLLPPGERLAQELPGLVEVEISGPQEAQHMLILWNLYDNKQGSKLRCKVKVTDKRKDRF